VLQLGGDFDLLNKTVGPQAHREFGSQNLDRDLAVKFQVLGQIDDRHSALAQHAPDGVTIGEGSCQAFDGVRHRCRRCELRRGSARYAEFGLPLGAPNDERLLGGAPVENANLLKRKRLAKYAVGKSKREPTDEEFMNDGFGEVR
jgi:hypothetical protein